MARAGAGKLDEARAGIRAAIESGVPAPASRRSWLVGRKCRGSWRRRTGSWSSASRRRRSITTGPGGASRWRRRIGKRGTPFVLAPTPIRRWPSRSGKPRQRRATATPGPLRAGAGLCEAAGRGAGCGGAGAGCAADVRGLGAYILVNAVRIELALGNPSVRSTSWKRTSRWPACRHRASALDPTYASLKGNPRFEKLLKYTGTGSVRRNGNSVRRNSNCVKRNGNSGERN